MKPLDFVRTPKGNIAIITVVSGDSASIDFIGGGNPNGEKSAWWKKSKLTIIDNLPRLLSYAMMGNCDGYDAIKKAFPIGK